MRARLTLISPDYTRLWFGQAVSTVGDAVFSTTLVLWVATVLAKGEPWAPQAVSGVLLAGGAAMLFVGPIAGVFVDRWNKRATMLGTEVLRGTIVAMLTAVSLLPVHAMPVAVWLTLIYVSVLVLNSTGQFFTPARFSVIAEMVSGEADRARAAGIAQATAQTAWIIGPPLAAPLLFSVGLEWALLLNAVSYLVSYIAIRSVDIPAAPVPERAAASAPEKEPGAAEPAALAAGEGRKRTGLLTEFRAGLRFFARSRFLVALLVLAAIGQLGMGALSTLNVFFVTGNLHGSAEQFGYFGMAMGFGGIAGALCAGRAVKLIGARRTTWIGLLITGTLLFVYSRQDNVVAGLVLMLTFAIPLTTLNTAMSPLLLAATTREFRGRVVAVFYPLTRLSSLLAAALSGWLAGGGLPHFGRTVAGMHFTPVDTIIAGAGVLVVAAGVYARIALPDTEAAPAPTPDPVPAVKAGP
ncbi:MFS transporter [Actinacidiphila bryophytorum]|uniref:Na+/melibiose symporter n=1 Tax=Actinacidiphila bryophytorum TaxID=1436133 RepID=A0A9W4H264_9ACTN|nr:MFS transporter [Actinacidiphila bryophytorum]MBM9440166.1 MFS transporter [Actinacidiphila bryophytorum]MBN6541826.1 MFS transporter [Actinacidiphila bryophytorum]CAG7645010.1 Na+/melibiose symporter [Actinacidiphila bryophytorum]